MSWVSVCNPTKEPLVTALTILVVKIGMGYHKIKKVLPADVDVVCHYSAHSCVISGPSAIVRHFTADLQKQDIHTQEISSSSITQHSRYAASAKLKLLSYLKQVTSIIYYCKTLKIILPVGVLT